MTTQPSVSNEINWTKSSFLVADSKALFRDMVQTALLSAGAKSVKHATSVDKAIEVLNRYGQEITCVICNWEMEPIGGLELLRMIRSRVLQKTSPRTPVVILTARADTNAVKAAMAMDVNGFAVAPLSFEKLVKTVAQAMARTWMLQQPAHYAAVPAVEITPPVPAAPVAREAAPPQPQPAAHAAPAAHVTRGPGINGGAPKPAPRSQELKNVHMCILSDVRPGQVLARDLRDNQGHLLLSAGAVLKPTLIDRLMNVAQGHGDSYHLWIGDRDDGGDGLKNTH